jgi:hypothetical protein
LTAQEDAQALDALETVASEWTRKHSLRHGRRAQSAMMLSERELERFRKFEPKLLKWLAASDENAAKFFADPLGALAHLGKAFDREDRQLIRKLCDIGRMNGVRMPATLANQISSIEVTVDQGE